VSFHGNRLDLITDRDMPLNLPVTVEHDDALYLGEVVKSCVSPQTGGDTTEPPGYFVEILIEQVLSGLQSLVTLRARLLDEQARADEQIAEEPKRDRRSGAFPGAR
jgi:hypothetical protein